jgi:hypothetical protein
MKNLMENFNFFLNESKNVYEAEILVKAEASTKLYGRIFEAIRGMEGVTVIRAQEGGIRRDAYDNKLLNLYVRFYVDPTNAVTYLQNISDKISALKDADGDQIIATRITKLPDKKKDFYT